MSRYEALTASLLSRSEPRVTLTFSELDSIVGGLPKSAKTYPAWWANNSSSQPHAKSWLDAGRRASPDFKAMHAIFTLDAALEDSASEGDDTSEGQQILSEYVESTISLERDLEDHLANHLEALEPGLVLVGRQETTPVGRIDLLARSSTGQTVVIELKAGEARDAAIGQIARYIGWYAQAEGKGPRAILVAGGFPQAVVYAASAIPALRLVTYRVSFAFADASL
ncbi:MAG: endonuclease NucS domain-containing protein [Pseudomarimonas sp.]